MHAVSFRKNPVGHIKGEQYASNVDEHKKSLDSFLQDTVQLKHTETPDPVEYFPGEHNVQLFSEIEPVPEAYLPELHITQVFDNEALNAVEYFPDGQSEQLSTLVSPDPV